MRRCWRALRIFEVVGEAADGDAALEAIEL